MRDDAVKAAPRHLPDDLHRRRRQAVQMRLAGDTLAAIAGATGLSVPTIVAAHKAYAHGGWAAVDAAKRGRPRRGHEVLLVEQEDALRAAIQVGTPPEAGLAAHTWQVQTVCELACAMFGVTIGARSISRLLQRWGLQAFSLQERLRDASSPLVEHWLQSTYSTKVTQLRQAGGRVLWVGEKTLDPYAPTPRASGLHLLHAHTPRGSMYWRISQGPPTVEDWIGFFDGLCIDLGSPLLVVMPHQALLKVAALSAWFGNRLRDITLLEPPVLGNSAMRASATSSSPPLSIPSTLLTSKSTMSLTHLQRLEAESIQIMREVVAEADNPVMLYSVGKDSAVMLHLARKAFYPAVPPFPLLHVDTRWKFQDMYRLRDRMAEETGMQLLVHVNPEGIEKNINPFTHGSAIHTDIMKTEGLKQALDKYQFDAAFGGARRDEEKSRAKERIFSFRNAQHRWDPKNQRPELWKLYNARKHKGESMRVFPISNWTELDIWQYIYLENIPIVPLYYAAMRPVVERDGTLIMVDDDRMPLKAGEVPMMRSIRFRTLGCYPLTGAVESEAQTLPAIIQEMLLTHTSERQGRVIDHDSSASMEKKKQEGYF